MSSLLEPKLLLHRKLSSTWSSAELAAYLESKPSFLSDISNVFRTLDQAIKLRVLFAFRALDSAGIAALPQEMLLAVLDEAGGDQDEWVKVCACMVRDALFGSSTGMTGPDSRPPAAEVTTDVLNKCGVLAEGPVDEKEKEEEAEAATAGAAGAAAAAVAGGSPAARARRRRRVEPEPYFCPMEYLYLSEPLIQGHHRQAPLTRKQNAHFVAGDLKDVEMETIPDSGLMPPPSLPPSLPISKSSSSSSSLLKPERQQQQPPPPPPRPSALPRPPSSSSSSSTPSSSSSSLLSQHHHTTKKDKPRLKLIKLDEIKTGGSNHAKTTARNEAVSQEFGSTQPLRLTLPKKPQQQPQQQQQQHQQQQQQQRAPTPPPPPPLPPSFAQSEESRKRSAAEALAGLLSPPPPSLPPPAATAPTTDALADYFRMKAKSNRLTPQDDERIRNFYLHGAREGGREAGGEEQQKVVKIKINEEEQIKEDGSKVKESLYLTLNYDSKKAVLSRKVSVKRQGG